MRLVVYQPDRITYWSGLDGGAIVMPMAPPDPQIIEAVPPPVQPGQNERPWPEEFKGQLPFVCFANMRDNFTRYGESEIRPAIPLQDVLNRTIYSMVMASEFAAFPVNWSIGMAINPGGIVPGGIVNMTLNDSAGAPLSEFTPEQIAYLQACKIGQLPAANISQYVNQIELIVKEISQATQTTIYGIGGIGRNMSGEALKQLEIGLLGKCFRFQRQNTDALKELIMLTSTMERVFAPGKNTPAVAKVNVTWKSPEVIDQQATIAALVDMRSKATGLWADAFYQQKIGQLLGMSKTDIEEEMKAADAERQSKIQSMAALQPASPFGQAQQPGQPGVPPKPGMPSQSQGGNGKANPLLNEQEELPL
jgi:hypothetical protein